MNKVYLGIGIAGFTMASILLLAGLAGAADVIDSTVGGMSKEQLVGTAVDTPQNPPVLDAAKVVEIVEHLKTPDQYNGHLGIARKLKVSMGQVKAVERAVQRRLRELAPEVIE